MFKRRRGLWTGEKILENNSESIAENILPIRKFLERSWIKNGRKVIRREGILQFLAYISLCE